jgi:MerR family transcriptional regulator, mercuric resistance operon regulatory protein
LFWDVAFALGMEGDARAQAKLAEVAAKIADLRVIAETLRAAVDAGCDDPMVCADNSCCPIPLAAAALGPAAVNLC